MENRLPTGEHNISRDDDDLSALPERNESTVLGHLRERFDAGTIYVRSPRVFNVASSALV